MKALTEKQSKFLQIFLGLVAGIGIWAAILIGSQSDNIILQYLFVIIFAVIIFVQRKIERTYEIRLSVFTKFWLIGLIVGLALFIIYGAVNGFKI